MIGTSAPILNMVVLYAADVGRPIWADRPDFLQRPRGPVDGPDVEVRLDDTVHAALSAVLARSATAQFVADPAGRWQMVNESWIRLTGLDVDAARGDGWIEAVDAGDRAEVMSGWWRATQVQAPFDQACRLRDADGSVVPVRLSGEPVEGPEGHIVAWVGSLDVEDEGPVGSVESEGFLRAALANSTDLVVVIDRDAVLTYASGAADRIVGVAPADLVGRSLLELVHPDDLGAASESLLSGLDSGAGVKDPVELRLRHANGGWRELEVVGNNLLDDPAVAGILISGRDVSERRLARRRELRARSRFEQAFQRSPIGMAITTLEGRFVRVNQALCELLGRTSTELLTTSVLDVTHRDDIETTARSAAELLHGNAPSFSLEKRFLDRAGNPIWTRSTVTLLRGDDEEPVHFLTQIEDVEDRRVLIEQLRRSALVDPLTGLANRAGPGGLPRGVGAGCTDRGARAGPGQLQVHQRLVGPRRGRPGPPGRRRPHRRRHPTRRPGRPRRRRRVPGRLLRTGERGVGAVPGRAPRHQDPPTDLVRRCRTRRRGQRRRGLRQRRGRPFAAPAGGRGQLPGETPRRERRVRAGRPRCGVGPQLTPRHA